MRVNKLFIPMFAFGALAITSCSSEEPLGGGNQYEEGEGIGYMAFTIASPESGTRAGDKTAEDNEIYNSGDANEYAICPNNQANVAFFFDDNDVFYGMSALQGVSQDNNHPNEGLHDGDKYGDTERYYTYITRWRNTNAKPTPSKVVVVLNANPDDLNTLATKLKGNSDEDLNTVLNYKFDTYDDSGNYIYGIYNFSNEKYFTMSNSSYINGENNVENATDITAKVFDTAEKALQSPVTVYVERLLAKYQLGFGANGYELIDGDSEFIFKPFADGGATSVDNMAKINYVAEYLGEDENDPGQVKGGNIDYPRYEPMKWQAYITNWGINGLEKEGRLIKDIETNRTDSYFDGWNNFGYHRSYWGESPLYSASGPKDFPTQYRNSSYDADPSDKFFGSPKYNPENETEQITALHYISFNDLKNRARYKYTAERTYNNQEEGNTAYGPYRYASHYLIGAQLIIPGVDEDLATKKNNQLTNVSDKWYAYNYFWANETDYIRYAYRRMATQVTDGRPHTMDIEGIGQSVTVEGALDGYFYIRTYPNSGEKFEKLLVKNAEQYFTTASAQNIHGDGKRVLAPKKGLKLYIRSLDKYNRDVYTELTAVQLTAMIYTFTDAARHYNKGAMYYAVPIQHMQGKSNGTKAEINKDATKPYAFAQFGTVRNHWYRLTVNKIGSIGTPVDNPDQPIIPDPEDEYHVALEIVVLPWHIINNGTVDLH